MRFFKTLRYLSFLFFVLLLVSGGESETEQVSEPVAGSPVPIGALKQPVAVPAAPQAPPTVGRRSADKEGNPLAKFYTHTPKRQIAPATPPSVTEVGFYHDWQLRRSVSEAFVPLRLKKRKRGRVGVLGFRS